MNPPIRHINKRFSDKKRAIDLLIAKDPEFHTLCEDYDASVDALHYWTESKAPEADIRVKEYRNLCRELEKEVTAVIKERGAR